jgi:hypothetical protein
MRSLDSREHLKTTDSPSPCPWRMSVIWDYSQHLNLLHIQGFLLESHLNTESEIQSEMNKCIQKVFAEGADKYYPITNQ